MDINLKLDFDLKRKIFHLSVPVYTSNSIPRTIQTYVDARQNHLFQPHATAFQKNVNHIALVQEITFNMFFRNTFRRQLAEFKKMARSCKKMFSEMAEEESLLEIKNIFAENRLFD